MVDRTSPNVFHSEAELDALYEAFESATLPCERWLHHQHLAIAVLYAMRQRPLEDLRTGIQRLNASHGVETTLTRGYHETITRFWYHILWHWLGERPEPRSRLETVNEAAEVFGDKEFILRFYSRERVMSAEARYGWVAPDLREMP